MEIVSTTTYAYAVPMISWKGVVDSTALGCDSKSKDSSSFWPFAFWIALFS